MRYVLDTSVIEHLANRANGWERIEASIGRVGIGLCAISAVTAYELRRHIERGPGRVRKENIARLEAMFGTIECIGMDLEIADLAGRLAAYLEDTGKSIGGHDPMIAATALVHGLACITDNTKHFIRVPGLALANWRL